MLICPYRYAIEKAKYEETPKQEVPASPPPVTSTKGPSTEAALAEAANSPLFPQQQEEEGPSCAQAAQNGLHPLLYGVQEDLGLQHQLQ